MRFVDFLFEIEGQVLPREEGDAAELAAQLLRNADGNVVEARKAADNHHKLVLAAIDRQGRFEELGRGGYGRGVQLRRSLPGYEDKPSPSPKFSKYA